MTCFSPLYMWKNYKINEHILSELKITPAINKIQNYINKWAQQVRRMDRERQVATLNCEMSTVEERKPRTTLLGS